MVLGPVLFARYAYMPNQLGYCGGDDNLALLEYGSAEHVDHGLLELERQFEGAYPYLQLIARANGIADPLDARVVEAYWVGNELLDRIDLRLLYNSLEERFRSRTASRDWHWLTTKPPQGARPHHSFHVMEIYPRVGLAKGGAVDHLMHTMEQCRIRWAKVVAVAGPALVVEVQPLLLREGKLELGDPQVETVSRMTDGKGFVDDVREGDWVSVHWGWACDVLTPRQRNDLERFTRRHIVLCNQTI